MQPWGAEKTSFKNIKNLTNLKLLTCSVYPSEMGVQSYSWWATFLQIWRYQATLKTWINWLVLEQNFAGWWPSRSRTAELYCIALPECCLQSPKLQPQALIA